MNVPPELAWHLDELVRVDLQSLRDSYFHWLLASSTLVAIGVILEGPEVVHEAIALFRRAPVSADDGFDYGVPTSLQPAVAETQGRPKPNWITWVALVGWIFVAVGVAGEGVSEALVSKADSLIQDFNDIVLADAQRQAAALERDAESERLARIKIEQQVADRHITVEQRKTMLTALAPGRGTPVVIGYVTDSGSDAPPYSIELADVFCDAKWEVSRPVELISYNPPLKGFLVDFVPGKTRKTVIDSVLPALAVTGYGVKMEAPSKGFELEGNVPACKTPPAIGNPPQYRANIEILVGSR